MAWAPDYITLAQLHAQLRVNDVVDDTAMGVAITAASRAIDYECNRQFGVTTALARVYTADPCLEMEAFQALAIDDVQTTTSLVVKTDLDDDGVYETTLTLGTDFVLWPPNAAGDGKPWTHLVMLPRSSTYLPWTARGIQITALWGWTAVPGVVTQATQIQAARFFVRRDSAYGVAGSPALGSEVRLLARLDPDVALLLTSVKRPWGAV